MTLTPGTTGRISRDGNRREWAIETLAVPRGLVRENDHTGCVPPGAVTVSRIRDPRRYTWPS